MSKSPIAATTAKLFKGESSKNEATVSAKITTDEFLLEVVKSVGSIQSLMKLKNSVTEAVENYQEIIDDGEEGDKFPVEDRIIKELKSFNNKKNFVWLDSEVGIEEDADESTPMNSPKLLKVVTNEDVKAFFTKNKFFSDVIDAISTYLMKKKPTVDDSSVNEDDEDISDTNQVYVRLIGDVKVVLHYLNSMGSVQSLYVDLPMVNLSK